MNYRRVLPAAIVLGSFTCPALASHGARYIDGYAVPFADTETVVTQSQGGPFGGSTVRREFEDEGDGFGIKGQFAVADFAYLTGEFQNVEFDDSEIELSQYRLGASFGPGAGIGQGLYAGAEYVNFSFDFPNVDDDDAEDQDGLAGHIGFGLPIDAVFRVYGQAGYLKLDDIDGPEFLLGVSIRLGHSLGLFADYRATLFEDDQGDELNLDDVRIGVRFHF